MYCMYLRPAEEVFVSFQIDDFHGKKREENGASGHGVGWLQGFPGGCRNSPVAAGIPRWLQEFSGRAVRAGEQITQPNSMLL